MNQTDLPQEAMAQALEGEALLSPLLNNGPLAGAERAPATLNSVQVGELLALADGGYTALVRFEGQPAAVRARTTVDLHGPHVGQQVVLMFEQGDPARPIVTGVLRQPAGWPMPEQPAQVEVDADGQRLVVSAKEQMVLRCGKASITLTKTGKVLIEGSYVLSRSTGVNRVKGGSVQLN